MTRRVYIYAFDELHKIVDVKFLQEDGISIRNMMWIAEQMLLNTDPIINKVRSNSLPRTLFCNIFVRKPGGRHWLIDVFVDFLKHPGGESIINDRVHTRICRHTSHIIHTLRR